MKQQYDVKGMHCASCANIIKRKLEKLPQVEHATVNLATETAEIDMSKSIDSTEINKIISPLGYTLTEKAESVNHDMGSPLAELAHLRNKTYFVLPVALLTFVLMIWDLLAKQLGAVPSMPLSMHVFNRISFILATPILFWIGTPYLQGVLRFIKYRVANMDSLVGIGTLVAYIYSTTLLLFPELARYLPPHGTHRAARPAPRRPEVHHHRHR
jgi:Cu2+-exporting ATPase/Cu+-exporting ATPase